MHRLAYRNEMTVMSNQNPTAADPAMLVAVYNQNWDNVRHIKNERISFMNTYSVISAGVLALFQSVHVSELIRTVLLCFMSLFSVFGLLTSLRLKGELEECLAKIEAMSVQARLNDFVALGQLKGTSARYPKFRWIFPTFYCMTTAGFVALIAYHFFAGESMR
jgi:hypothetical protein